MKESGNVIIFLFGETLMKSEKQNFSAGFCWQSFIVASLLCF